MTPVDVLIVGGGVWGLSLAWHLSLAHGLSVRVLERRASPAMETSAQAAGQIGQVRETTIARLAALYALEFASSVARRQHSGAFVRSGSVTVLATAEAAMAAHARFAAASAAGLCVDELSAAEAAALVPGLTDRIARAYHVPSDGYVEPAMFTRALADDAQDAGVHVVCDAVVNGFDIDASQVRAVRTSHGRLSAGHIVIAAGPWTASLLPTMPLAAWPIVLRQGRTSPAGVAREHPVVRFPEASAYLRPEAGGYLIGAFRATPELTPSATLPSIARTEDIVHGPAAIDDIRDRLAAWLPALSAERIAHHRQGWITMTPDGLPIVGRHVAADNLWFATGCGAMGFVWAPAIGRWLAQSIAEGALVPALAPLAPARFGPLAQDTGRLRAACQQRHANYYGLADPGTARPGPVPPHAEHQTWK